MPRILKFAVAGLVMAGLAACAARPQPVVYHNSYQDLPRPAGKPCDAKTQLEYGRRVC